MTNAPRPLTPEAMQRWAETVQAAGLGPGAATSEKRPRRFRTAVHEAGHAVFALDLGVRFRSVTIVPDGHSDGALTHFAKRSEFRRFTAEQCLHRMMVNFAGRVAERAAGYRTGSATWEHDRHNAITWAERDAGFSTEIVEAWLRLAMAKTKALEEHLRPEIHALAMALVERGTVTEKESREVVKAAREQRWASAIAAARERAGRHPQSAAEENR